jgi:hypothetical protein
VNVFQKCKILLRFGARRDFPANQAEARHKGEARIPFPNRKMQSLRIISEGRKGKMRFSRVKKKDSEQTDAMFSDSLHRTSEFGNLANHEGIMSI